MLLVFGQELKLEGANTALGAGLVFASTLSYALYLVYSGEEVKRLGALRLTGLATSVACVLCIAQFLLLRPWHSALQVATPVLWLSLLNATLCTFAPVLMVMMAIERIGAAMASQAGMIGPLSTIAMSVWILGEAFTAWIAAGTVLVHGGHLAADTQPIDFLQRRRHMDLGINGKWALVCAASKGLGKGCAAALVREGVNVVITARGDEALQATAAELRALNPAVQVRAVAGDITTVPQAAPPRWPPARRSTSWSTTPAGRRRATSATGTATPGSRRSTPTC